MSSRWRSTSFSRSRSPSAGGTSAYLRFFATAFPFEVFFGIAAGALVMRGKVAHAVPALVVGVSIIAALVPIGELKLLLDGPGFWGRVFLAGSGFGLILYGLVVLEKRHAVVFPRWIDTLGDASYAMYLWHIPLLTVLGFATLRLHAHGLPAHLVIVAAAFAFVAAAGVLIYRYVECPLTTALLDRAMPLFDRAPAPAPTEAAA